MKIQTKPLLTYFCVALITILLLSSCSTSSIYSKQISITPTSPAVETQPEENAGNTLSQTQIPVTTNTPPVPLKCWFEEKIPEEVIKDILSQNNCDREIQQKSADLWVSHIISNNSESDIIFSKLLVISIPFKYYLTDISNQEINKILTDQNFISEKKIWVNPQNLVYLRIIYNDLVLSNLLVSDQIPQECQEGICFRILSFDEIEPEWRVLAIDENNPLHTSFGKDIYPLIFHLQIEANPGSKSTSISEVNLHPIDNYYGSQITSVILSGTTALVRNTALMMEENGVLYPSENIGSILRSADITHISNEVSFFDNCPPAIPLRKELRFCSDPKYLQLFSDIGVDVIELTGNHLLDWGPQALLQTLDLYTSHGFSYYGGGTDSEDAQKPLIISTKGNTFVFIGCNVAGPSNDWATPTRPGALQCNVQQIIGEIASYKAKGYIPIVTIQHYEVEDFAPLKQVKQDFWQYANSGAVIVSGSQAHFPQGFDFVNGSFIHYGVGNLFFDQMDNWLRKATIDIHYFYLGKYLNTEMVGILNENFGQPRVMSNEESAKFFEKMFEYSFYYDEDTQ